MSFAFDPMAMIGGIMSAANQRQANAIAMYQIQEQRRLANEQMRFAQAGREDPFGNIVKYNPATNKWEIDLTDMQRNITTAGEREQLATLTEDATRNRNKRRVQEERAKGAGSLYSKALTQYQYDQPPDERALANENARLIGWAKEDTARGNNAGVARTLTREGRGAMIPYALRDMNDDIAGSLADTLLKARQAGMSEHSARTQQHFAETMQPMQFFSQLMDQIGDAPQNYSKLPEFTMQNEADMAGNMSKALASIASNMNTAYSSAVQAAGKPLNLSGMRIAMSSGGGYGGLTTPYTPGLPGSNANLTVYSPPVSTQRGNMWDYGVDVPDWMRYGGKNSAVF